MDIGRSLGGEGAANGAWCASAQVLPHREPSCRSTQTPSLFWGSVPVARAVDGNGNGGAWIASIRGLVSAGRHCGSGVQAAGALGAKPNGMRAVWHL